MMKEQRRHRGDPLQTDRLHEKEKREGKNEGKTGEEERDSSRNPSKHTRRTKHKQSAGECDISKAQDRRRQGRGGQKNRKENKDHEREGRYSNRAGKGEGEGGRRKRKCERKRRRVTKHQSHNPRRRQGPPSDK